MDRLNTVPYIETDIGKLTRVPINPSIPVDRNNPATYKHIEKNTDVKIASDMLSSTADIIVLLSADSDFESVVERLKESSKQVVLVIPIGAKSSQMQHLVGRDNIIYLDKSFFDACLYV